MGKDSNSKKSKAVEPYPMGGVKAKGGLGAEGQSSKLTPEQRLKRKEKKAKQKLKRKQAEVEAPATDEAPPAGEESESSEGEDEVEIVMEKEPEPTTRKEKARERAEAELEELANSEPKKWSEDPLLPDLPTEWPEVDLSPVLVTGLDNLQGLSEAEKGCFVGVVPYGYESIIQAHIHLVTQAVQAKVKEAYPEGGFFISNWNTDLVIGLGVTKQGGEMDQECGKVAEWLVNPANRVLIMGNQSFLVGGFAGLNAAGTTGKARHSFLVSKLSPKYWKPEPFLKGWSPLCKGPLAKLTWLVLPDKFANVKRVEVECTFREWAEFRAKRNGIVKKFDKGASISEDKVVPSVKYDQQRAKADARKKKAT
ncbi:hypothetical protein FRC07_001843 [Ceratobasidium sp. 392]|nr:hypothetical protein FRC07_001843 [Ceratobasidium sp. 392]